MSAHNRVQLIQTCLLKNYIKNSAFSLVFLVPLLSFSTAYSDNNSQLTGRVISKISGNPVEHTLVYLKPGYRYAETNAQGEFVISNLEPGRYLISTRHVGYYSDQNKQIELNPGVTVTMNFSLVEKYYSTSDAIVVSATRSKSITQELPYTMSVVSPERISLLNPLNMSETLINIQGAYIKDYGSVGNLKTVSLRGSNAGQVLVLLDGQRLNNPQTGEKDLSTISLDGIEQVEILRGGSSAIYGADAIGGVLNLITGKGRETNGIGASLRLLEGSYATRSLDGSFNFKNNLLNGLVTYRKLTSDGDFSFMDKQGNEKLRENNDLTSHHLFSTMKFRFGHTPFDSELNMSYGYYLSERGVPGSLDFPSLRARQWDTSQQFQTQLKGKIFNLLHSYSIQGFWNWNKTRFKDPDPFVNTDAKNKSGNFGIESYMRSTVLPNQMITYGGGYRQEWMLSNQFLDAHDRDIYFFYTQYEVQFKSIINESQISIDMIPALRYDQYSDFGSRWSPKIGVCLSVGSEPQVILKSDAGLNFRAPTFNELYWPADTWSRGNPDLVPESGFDWDFGISLRFPAPQRFDLDLNYFDTKMEDLIQWQSVNQVFMPVNVNKSRVKGLELTSSIRFFENFFEIIGNYTYLDAKNNSEGAYRNKFLVYRSRHNLKLTLNWKWDILSCAYDYRYASRQYGDEANSADFEIKPYDLSDLTLSFKQKFNKWQPTFTFQIRNIFDKNYQIIHSYPLPGREYRISLAMAYN